MAQNIFFAAIIAVPVLAVLISVIQNIIEEREAYRNSLNN